MTPESVMAGQRGLITREQARDVGMSRSQIRSRVDRGLWSVAQAGVFRSCSIAVDWRQQAMAAAFAVNGVVSHRAASALWDLPIFCQPIITVSQPHSRRPKALRDATLYRSTQWEARQQTTRHGIPCTGIERTIMDVAGTINVAALERIAEDAVRRRLTSFGSLATYLAWHGKKGRTGSATLRALLESRAPNGVVPLSDFSRRVVQLLDRHGVARPEVEYRIVDGDRFVMQADLAWPDQMKVVELDGLAWHFGRNDVERDRRKRGAARAAGWRIHEVLWTMFADDPHGLAQDIRRFLAS